MQRFAQLLSDSDRQVTSKDVETILPLLEKVDDHLERASDKLIASILEDPTGLRMRVTLMAAARFEEIIKELHKFKQPNDPHHQLFSFLEKHGGLSTIQVADLVGQLDTYPFFYEDGKIQACEFETKESYYRMFRQGDTWDVNKDGGFVTDDPFPLIGIMQKHWDVAFELFKEN
jgi:hypothetical protein